MFIAAPICDGILDLNNGFSEPIQLLPIWEYPMGWWTELGKDPLPRASGSHKVSVIGGRYGRFLN